MPRNDKYTGRLRVTGEISATNVVNYGLTGKEIGHKVRVVVSNTTITNAESGGLVIVSNSGGPVFVTMPPVASCNGCWFRFANINTGGMTLVGATNCFQAPYGAVNAVDYFAAVNFIAAVNYAARAEVWGDGTRFIVLSPDSSNVISYKQG